MSVSVTCPGITGNVFLFTRWQRCLRNAGPIHKEGCFKICFSYWLWLWLLVQNDNGLPKWPFRVVSETCSLVCLAITTSRSLCVVSETCSLVCLAVTTSRSLIRWTWQVGCGQHNGIHCRAQGQRFWKLYTID